MTIQQALELGLRHHQAGKLAEAESIYRQILALEPRHAQALHLLGVIALQVGRPEVAAEFIAQAIAVAPGIPEYHSNIAEAYRALGDWDKAIAACRQAIVLAPHLPEPYSNLGNALKANGQVDEAIGAYRQAIALKPNYANAHGNLGTALKEQGRLDEAIDCYRQAISLNPNTPEVHCNLGVALRDKGQFDEAIAASRQATVLNPNLPDAHYVLANALGDKGQLDEAVAAYRQAIHLRPNYVEAYLNLGNTLKDKGHVDEAIGVYRQTIALNPSGAEAYLNLANVLKDQGQVDEAIASYRQAIALKPSFPEAYNNLGTALKENGLLDESIASCRHAMILDPGFAEAHSNLVFNLRYHPGYAAAAIAQEERRWNQQHAAPLGRVSQSHANNRDPDRRLRIGYVSPDFRDHVVGRYILPLIERHDRTQFEVFCYSEVCRADEMTARFRSLADQWKRTLHLPDQRVAEMIREDGVDILVDLSLHTAGNRLLVFARKPAPVQVSYAGYPGSTGLEAIEYRISDRWLEAEMGDGRSEIGWKRNADLLSPNSDLRPAERVSLIDSFWCYDPRGADVPVNALPGGESQTVTFGCLNNFCKVNEKVLALWARILRQVDGARLMMLSFTGSHQQRVLTMLRQLGVEESGVEFVAPRPWPEYLQLYHRIDIGLDTFPYNGHTTSLDAFWMGVPVIGLPGKLPVSRAGLSNLMNLGLPELVAETEEDYVRLAVELARDVPRLVQLRATLRERMKGSVLMDASRFTRQIEQAYRGMWREWCSGAE